MSILPVMDLKDGVVVRGIAGERDAYQAVESCVAKDPSPRSVASAFLNEFGFDSVYVADLDAIEGRSPNWDALHDIDSIGVKIWIDCGLSKSSSVEQMRTNCAKLEFASIIVALESIASIEDLIAIHQAIDNPVQAVFSLDLKHGQILIKSPHWHDWSPIQIANAAVENGFTRLIVLDLASVGSEQGPGVETLCNEIRATHPDLEITSGGGVRHIADIHRFLDAGCDNVLVASALHNGRIDAASVKSFR